MTERSYFRRGNVGGFGQPYEWGAMGGQQSVLTNPEANNLDWIFQMQPIPDSFRRGNMPNVYEEVDEVADFDRLNSMYERGLINDMTPNELQRLDRYWTWIEGIPIQNQVREHEYVPSEQESPFGEWTPPTGERKKQLERDMFDVWKDIYIEPRKRRDL